MTGPPELLWQLPTWLINQVAGHAFRLVTNTLEGRGFRTNHFALLAALEDLGPSSQAILARRLGMDASDVGATLNELQARALITRTPDQRNRRRNAVSLTARGKAELARLTRLVEQAQIEALEPLTESERAKLRAMLRRVVEYHAAWQPAKRSLRSAGTRQPANR
jgi:DNA-binding MarR family transcriptional regulator